MKVNAGAGTWFELVFPYLIPFFDKSGCQPVRYAHISYGIIFKNTPYDYHGHNMVTTDPKIRSGCCGAPSPCYIRNHQYFIKARWRTIIAACSDSMNTPLIEGGLSALDKLLQSVCKFCTITNHRLTVDICKLTTIIL